MIYTSLSCSGCGKTTLLDLLTGRRQPTKVCYLVCTHVHVCTLVLFQGEIFVNGLPMEEVQDWYAAHTGYVLQLAMPYYERLTVRDNLILAAQIKLSSSFTSQQKFERVEQVMAVVCSGVNKICISANPYNRQVCSLWLTLLLAWLLDLASVVDR